MAMWRFVSMFTLFFAPLLDAQTPPSWTQQFPSSSPAPRVYQSMAYDSVHGQTVMFGGQDFSGAVGYTDTWVWDGSNWTQMFPQHSPPAQSAHAMVYDSAHDQAVLFSLNYTWLWDGTTWIPVPPPGPSGRYGHAMAFDSLHGQVVLFGGADANNSSSPTLLGDTWIWDGHSWTQQSPQNSPSARYQHAMAFDSAHGQVVLFGGLNGNLENDSLGDTWLWDGTNWTQASPQTSPTARNDHAMAYDSAQGQVVLFGGIGGPGNDTWLWDGSNWTVAPPQAGLPPGRSAQSMVYDSAHDQVVMFGGYSLGSSIPVLGDIWTYGVGAVPISGPSIDAVNTASEFGNFPQTTAPGSWIEIYGYNLASATGGWTGADFTGNNAPTMLGGVSVTIGGQPAFVDYISPYQVNAQVPSNIATGELQLTITNAGVTGAPVDVTINATQPGLLAPTNFFVISSQGGSQYVAAILPDGSYVLPAGAVAGVTSRPAKPGETILMFGVGFGPVTPNIPAGVIATGDSQLSLPFEISFGQTQAQLSYFGLAPTFVGLYQFNVTVPAVPDSDLVPLTFNLGDTPGMQTLFTAVHQ
jgi:uncharacterized protein (TIGR03437 family)